MYPKYPFRSTHVGSRPKSTQIPLCPPFSKGESSLRASPLFDKEGRGDFCAEWRRELFKELWFQHTREETQ
jgi:hypothetical protein